MIGTVRSDKADVEDEQNMLVLVQVWERDRSSFVVGEREIGCLVSKGEFFQNIPLIILQPCWYWLIIAFVIDNDTWWSWKSPSTVRTPQSFSVPWQYFDHLFLGKIIQTFVVAFQFVLKSTATWLKLPSIWLVIEPGIYFQLEISKKNWRSLWKLHWSQASPGRMAPTWLSCFYIRVMKFMG